MYPSNVHLLDLPDEILFIILKKLNNLDVLYSFININNERLEILAKEAVFTDTLDLYSISSSETISSSDGLRKVDRFCTDILPRIHHKIKYLMVESTFMDRILSIASYPNLKRLQIHNFQQTIASRFSTGNKNFQFFKQQLTDLILVNNDVNRHTLLNDYTKNVYVQILIFFQSLKYLNIIENSISGYMPLSLIGLSSTIFASSTLTYLSIMVNTFNDCLHLLDGRLKHLSVLIVRIYSMENSSVIHNMDDLPNLKQFSLKCYDQTNNYDNKIVSLLRRMTHLQKLSLYLRIRHQTTIINDIHIQNEILNYMPQLQSFHFYISVVSNNFNLFHSSLSEDIQETFRNIGYQQVSVIVNSSTTSEVLCHIFSLPFLYDGLLDIGNNFPNVIFNNVTYLSVNDRIAFQHEFFIRIARAFPLLKTFVVANFEFQSRSLEKFSADDQEQIGPVVTFPHLTSLNLRSAIADYTEQFLNERKTYLPCLSELGIGYEALRKVTKDFTRDATRRNCSKVKNLITLRTLVLSKEFYLYFPFL